ncbi:hypothetical protein EV286_107510 [Rhizobium sp. BK251]|nr:hypothetical protein EV286_107510 [Rhizobium sp. BK251]
MILRLLLISSLLALASCQTPQVCKYCWVSGAN